jgi:hypothetical protein
MSRKYGDLMIFFWERQEQAPKFKILKRNCIKNLTCNVKQKKKKKEEEVKDSVLAIGSKVHDLIYIS